MAKLHSKISTLVRNIYKDEYVSDIELYISKRKDTELPYSKTSETIEYSEPYKLRGFYTSKESDLTWINYGKKQQDEGNILISVEDLQKVGLWNYDKNISKITQGRDLIKIYNTEHIIETVTNVVVLDNKFIFVEIKFYNMSYNKDLTEN